MTKTVSSSALQNAFNIVAFSSLKENNEPLNPDNIETEAARIERCVEYHYQRDKSSELHYNTFAANFLQENFNDIVFTDKYLGFYLDDVVDEEDKKQYPLNQMSIMLGG
jgi:hypothetical protein